MRRIYVTILLVCAMTYSTMLPISAVAKVGAACTVVNKVVKSGNQVLTCTKVKNKFSWKVATAAQAAKFLLKLAADKATQTNTLGLEKICVPGGKCPIGSKGPMGGIIFYDAGKQQSWGRFLEAAPSAWSGRTNDRPAAWCDNTQGIFGDAVADPTLMQSLGVEIGKGKANTKVMLEKCNSGAAVLVHTYTGGGQSDWFLPSKDELNELCKFAHDQITGDTSVGCTPSGTLREGFVQDGYWSSSEFDKGFSNAWFQVFFSGGQAINPKENSFYVRPVRAF